jgi:hypothetical protein
MALAQTDLPELRRFTFFVSRRFEEGRERFRLHMGYFATLAEAEEWLNVVREIYPGAWAGEAPGRKLRERAAAAAAAQAQYAAGPQPHASAAPARAAVAQPAAVRVPVVHPAPPSAQRGAPPVARQAVRQVKTAPLTDINTAPPPPPRSAGKAPPLSDINTAPPPPPRSAPVRTPPRADINTAPPPPPRSAVAKAPALSDINTAPPPPPRRPPVQAPPRAAQTARTAPAARPALPATPPAAAAGAKGVFEDSNVREVLKALGDASATGETRLMRSPPAPRAAPAQNSSMSDTQVLKLLETRRPEGAEPQLSEPTEEGGIPMLKPDDTGTRQALKEAVASNAPVSFAVQLQWSVQPVELDKVPPLAIFSAYTLYTVEGSRDERKWYGLRLGFFSDAISAKQVAHYVRSEFTSVAVVPVSPQEKARATDQDTAAALAAPAPARSDPMEEFKLFDDDRAARSAPQPRAAAQPPAGGAVPAAKAAAPRPGQAPAVPVKGRVRARDRVAARDQRGPQTLEETLEILGASQLSIDSGSGETLNESGVRHLRVEVQKNSPFSKLLERLSERLKKP